MSKIALTGSASAKAHLVFVLLSFKLVTGAPPAVVGLAVTVDETMLILVVLNLMLNSDACVEPGLLLLAVSVHLIYLYPRRGYMCWEGSTRQDYYWPMNKLC